MSKYKVEQLEYYRRRREILVFYRDILVGINPAPGSDLDKALQKLIAEIAENQNKAKEYLTLPHHIGSEA